MSGLLSSSSYVPFFHPITWYQLIMISSGRWLLKQTRNKDTVIGRHCFSMELDMGTVFCFTSPWLLLPCHSSPPFLTLYYSYVPAVPMPWVVCRLSVHRMHSQQVWNAHTALLSGLWHGPKEKKARTEVLWGFFHSLFFTQIFMGLLGTSYILKFLLLCRVTLKLAAHLEFSNRHRNRQKDVSINMCLSSHILGHIQMWLYEPPTKSKAIGEVFGLLESKRNLGRLYCLIMKAIYTKSQMWKANKTLCLYMLPAPLHEAPL